ncbi:hypothetical protein GQ53DRAFT_844886 [Thozetella sp. PMI_491]|nr:hypothetical protein GQ53DRAFT_844886 [Thozetella sp. PMI_491]
MLSKLAILTSILMGARALPSGVPIQIDDEFQSINGTLIEKRTPNCAALVSGLSLADCNYIKSMGMAHQGVNARSSNGNIWIGSGGPNTFTFTNRAETPSKAPITLVIWDAPAGDYSASFMNVKQPKITYSLPNYGDSVTISVANGISGAWSPLTNRATTLSQYGQIYNTWGEFTTGAYATVDVSREVKMNGNIMSIKVKKNGCVSDMNTCAFQCKSGNSCGESGTYKLVNCANGSQPGASYGVFNGNPSGGCQGWSNGGHLDIDLKRL